MTNRIYLAVQPGSVAFTKIMEWRDELARCEVIWVECAKKFGATTWMSFPYMAPGSFVFDRAAPEGWTKPDNRGSSRPKKNNKTDSAEVSNLPSPPHVDRLMGELGLPSSVKYDRGWSRIGAAFHCWQVCWSDDQLFAVGGDWRKTIADLAEYDGRSNFEFNHGDGSIPEGFEEITKAEMELIFATNRVKHERESKSD